MAVPPSYPGVYISELPSGQRPIAPVPTNIAVFVGRAPIGPADAPITIFNFGDYTRLFGGLSFGHPISYAVQDFFANGGAQAIIVRLFESEADKGDGVARLQFAVPGISFPPSLALKAASPGDWGNTVRASVDFTGITGESVKQFSKLYGLGQSDLFNLTITQYDASGRTISSERYLNVSANSMGKSAAFPNRLDRVLADQSNLARVEVLSEAPPSDGAVAAGSGGNDGTYLSTTTYLGNRSRKTSLYMLEKVELFNLLCIPPDRRILPNEPEEDQDLDPVIRQAAATWCADRRAFFIVDPPVSWSDKARQGRISAIDPETVGIKGTNSAGAPVARNAAVYFPRIWKEDILMEGKLALFPVCGTIAGVIAATDAAGGVWKAPAGLDAGLANVAQIEFDLTDAENGQLNPLGINCLRDFPVIGPVVWGARTLSGADELEDDYKYIPVRRLTLFIEESICRGTQWAVFEPNDEALWSSLRLSAAAFLEDLARQGAFYNYAVTCDATPTTPNDIANGVVNILVQFAPVKPAEFVGIRIQQPAGQPSG